VPAALLRGEQRQLGLDIEARKIVHLSSSCLCTDPLSGGTLGASVVQNVRRRDLGEELFRAGALLLRGLGEAARRAALRNQSSG
jgi:hypothetical protein